MKLSGRILGGIPVEIREIVLVGDQEEIPGGILERIPEGNVKEFHGEFQGEYQKNFKEHSRRNCL